MILIGSRALNTFIPLGRVMHDWDYLPLDVFQYESYLKRFEKYIVKKCDTHVIMEIANEIIEIKNPEHYDESDKTLTELPSVWEKQIRTPLGLAWVPDIQTLYDIKKSTAMCIDHWKHEQDVKLIEENFKVQGRTVFFERRLEYTQDRLKVSNDNKFDFFHKTAEKGISLSSIPEYIEHDYLHVIIADLMGLSLPTYLRFVTSDVGIEDELWFNMTHSQRISAMVEESLVLSLERWFIPQMIENGINYRLLDLFFSNNEANAPYQILYHCCVRGLIGEKLYITNFARENFGEIEKEWINAKENIKNKGLPSHFFEKIFKIRAQYLNGEKVGLHQR